MFHVHSHQKDSEALTAFSLVQVIKELVNQGRPSAYIAELMAALQRTRLLCTQAHSRLAALVTVSEVLPSKTDVLVELREAGFLTNLAAALEPTGEDYLFKPASSVSMELKTALQQNVTLLWDQRAVSMAYERARSQLAGSTTPGRANSGGSPAAPLRSPGSGDGEGDGKLEVDPAQCAVEFHKLREQVQQLLLDQRNEVPPPVALSDAGDAPPVKPGKNVVSGDVQKTVNAVKMGRVVPKLPSGAGKDNKSVASHLQAFLHYVRESLALPDDWFEKAHSVEINHFVALLQQHYENFPSLHIQCSRVRITEETAPIDVVAAVAVENRWLMLLETEQKYCEDVASYKNFSDLYRGWQGWELTKKVYERARVQHQCKALQSTDPTWVLSAAGDCIPTTWMQGWQNVLSEHLGDPSEVMRLADEGVRKVATFMMAPSKSGKTARRVAEDRSRSPGPRRGSRDRDRDRDRGRDRDWVRGGDGSDRRDWAKDRDSRRGSGGYDDRGWSGTRRSGRGSGRGDDRDGYRGETDPYRSPRGKGGKGKGGRGSPSPRSPGECYNWKLQGTCSWGDDCRFLHDTRTAAPSRSRRTAASDSGPLIEEVEDSGSSRQAAPAPAGSPPVHADRAHMVPPPARAGGRS